MSMPRSKDYDDYFEYEEAMYDHMWGIFGPIVAAVVIAAVVLVALAVRAASA